MSITNYNYKIIVNYANNTEYRKCFRQAFCFDEKYILEKLKQQYPDFDTFEHDTKDELIYDEFKVEQIMDEIMKTTKFIKSFSEIYKKAASFVISDNSDIGLSILLGYDYFQDFHKILSEWFNYLDNKHVLYNFEKQENISEMDNFIKETISMKKLYSRLFH